MGSLSLDDEQKEVVEYTGSTLLVAGPGSGKTRTLVAKAEKLYEGNSDFICLTFTRAAAKEMRDRMPGIRAQTVHSYCHDVVGWMDGYDRMLEAVVEKKTKEKFDWVLVDEVQDLTDTQWEVVESLVGRHLFAVGDPYQSIYGWNDALGVDIIERLRSFGCKEFLLHNNYRSCPLIVSALNWIYKRDLVSKGVKSNGLTGILTRTRKQVAEITFILKSAGVGFTVRTGASELGKPKEENFGSETLRVMTSHCSKGLEFDKVILYSWRPKNLPWARFSKGSLDEEVNLYYVSLARASQTFSEVWSAEKLLEELDDKSR